jgi:hypothetical protein
LAAFPKFSKAPKNPREHWSNNFGWGIVGSIHSVVLSKMKERYSIYPILICVYWWNYRHKCIIVGFWSMFTL